MNTNDTNEKVRFLELESLDCVVDRGLKFKAKLKIDDDTYAILMEGNKAELKVGVGDNAYEFLTDGNEAKLKVGVGNDIYAFTTDKKVVQSLLNIGGAAMSRIISHGPMAAKFLSTKLAALGAVSATSIGWIAASVVLSGGIYFGVMYLYEKYRDTGADVDPGFIKSPVDLLAADLFDMLASLALKIAHSSGGIEESERQSIISHFVDEWGISADYAEKALPLIEQNLGKATIKERIEAMMKFQLENPNCKPRKMKKEFMELLSEVAHADGQLDEQEEITLELVEREIDFHLSLSRRFNRSVKNLVRSAWGKIKPSKATAQTTENDQDPST